MIKYDWELLYKLCNFNKFVVIDYLLYIRGFTKKCPKRKLKELKAIPQGKSYILDLDSVLADNSVSKLDKFQYIELCSKRNLATYQFFRNVALNKVFVEEVVKYNRLITETKTELLFKYEEEALRKQ